MASRDHLPFRKNTEGYFLDRDDNILAHDTGVGYLEFPGGGIEPNETPEKGILRETLEETGAIIDATTLKKLGVMHFLWDEKWAKTEKQRQRYQQFKGEEMHFFFGRIKGWKKVSNVSEAWNGEKLMPVHRAIRIIENEKATKAIEEYRSFQLKFLKDFKQKNNLYNEDKNMQNHSFELKNDRYRKARGGDARLLDIFCASCNRLLMKYQKDGKGNLLRCYLNRIFYPPQLEQLQHDQDIQSPRDMSNLSCNACKSVIGTPMFYEDGRLAFRLRKGLYYKKLAE